MFKIDTTQLQHSYFVCRVASAPHVKKNAMPASNLGIVFGPTLLRRRYVNKGQVHVAQCTTYGNHCSGGSKKGVLPSWHAKHAEKFLAMPSFFEAMPLYLLSSPA